MFLISYIETKIMKEAVFSPLSDILGYCCLNMSYPMYIKLNRTWMPVRVTKSNSGDQTHFCRSLNFFALSLLLSWVILS